MHDATTADPRPVDLNNLRYLFEVVDGGSFSAAARALGAPPSLVSRKIARLEAELGARLFHRTTRSVRLTDAGQAFADEARQGLAALTRARERLGALATLPHGRVRLSAPAGLAEALWPSIAGFLRRFPEVRVELELADRYVDLIEERFDVAIRSGPAGRVERLVGRRLMDAPRRLYASPAYLREHGTPTGVAALKDHRCVVVGPRAGRVAWEIHTGPRRRQVVAVDAVIAVNEARLAATCAADGFGIAFLPFAVCHEHVAAGRLRPVLPRANGGEIALWLVYPDRHLPAASRLLVETLARELPAALEGRLAPTALAGSSAPAVP